ncbi:hypothetical protein QVD17_03490 [Tagetes erecta]|uniref:DUF7912 domain-containing protein n=1 Tax=Tagetes erecta TaxID=13708 RepID=A0AAD8LBE0_TARER|nr:hypothetical protein QVD17_03490 [Tagetes erecta]
MQRKDFAKPIYWYHHFPYLSPNLSSSFNLSFSIHPHNYTTTNTEHTHTEKPQQLVVAADSNGGGVVIQNCSWGEKALSIAQDVLLQFDDDIQIFAFKISPRGYIYVRLERLCNEFLSVEDIQSYSHKYMKKLVEAGAVGDIPTDLALEVSSPDADRSLRIPNDLQRFKNKAMRVKYVRHDDSKSMKKEGIFFLESIEMDSGSCVWRLADVKENRDRSCKGRPLTRKQKDWRLKLSYEMLEQVTLYLDYK